MTKDRQFTMANRAFTYAGDGRISDENFDFDAGFKVSGDFVGDDKDNYCRMIVAALNAVAQAAPPAAPAQDARAIALEDAAKAAEYACCGHCGADVAIRALLAAPAAPSQPGEMGARLSYEDEMAQTLGFKNALDAVVWAGFMKGASAQQDEREQSGASR